MQLLNFSDVSICQSHDSYKKECQAIDTLIHQNVDCIFISPAIETTSASYLQHITKNNIALIQVDRNISGVKSSKVFNDNEMISYIATKHLIDQGYNNVAFIGGPKHSSIFLMRKKGFLKMMKEAGIKVPDNFIVECAIENKPAYETAKKLLSNKERPDAFITVSDYQALGVMQAANTLGIAIPKELGIIGFSNETFTGIVSPTLSTVDQRSKEIGRRAAHLYFDKIRLNNKKRTFIFEEIISANLIIRESSSRSR